MCPKMYSLGNQSFAVVSTALNDITESQTEEGKPKIEQLAIHDVKK